jgi:hypothetical protein
MKEAEWFACTNPHQLLGYVRGRASRSLKGRRKLRLFACAAVRGIWPHLTDERSRRAVEVSERYADGLAGVDELRTAREEAESPLGSGGGVGAPQAAATVVEEDVRRATQVIVHVSSAPLPPSAGVQKIRSRWDAEFRRLCDVLRDIFGNPFRPVTLDPAWPTRVAVGLAQGIYDERRFGDLPILADALEEAGWTDQNVLSHLRRPTGHVRGCWALDLVLAKK